MYERTNMQLWSFSGIVIQTATSFEPQSSSDIEDSILENEDFFTTNQQTTIKNNK